MPTVRNVLLHLEVKITIPLNAKRPSFSAAQIWLRYRLNPRKTATFYDQRAKKYTQGLLCERTPFDK